MSVIGLGYIVLDTTDCAAWGNMATQILGFAKSSHPLDPDFDYYKMDDRVFRVMVRKADRDHLGAAGWQVSDKKALEAVKSKLESAGVEVNSGDDQDARARAVEEVIFCLDPAGNNVEIFYGPAEDKTAFVSPVGVPSFVTGEMGMGHVVLPAENLQECYDFYVDLLGFALSDELQVPMGPEGPVLGLKFMHADNPRHHSLALFEGPHPGGCIHWMVEVPDVDVVGLCMDRARAAKLPLFASFGRHSNDNMLSVYFMSPGGIGIEYGCDGKIMDWQGWEPVMLESGDIWGHAYEMMNDE